MKHFWQQVYSWMPEKHQFSFDFSKKIVAKALANTNESLTFLARKPEINQRNFQHNV